MHAELGKDALEVGLHGQRADPQTARDLGHGPAVRQRAEDLGLAGGQTLEDEVIATAPAPPEMRQDGRQVPLRKQELARVRPADDVGEVPVEPGATRYPQAPAARDPAMRTGPDRDPGGRPSRRERPRAGAV